MRILLKILIFFFFVIGSANSFLLKEDTIAIAGEKKILVKHFIHFLKNNLQSYGLIDDLTPEEFRMYLNSYIDEQLILNYYENDSMVDSTIEKNVADFRNLALVNKLIEYCVIDSIISGKKLKDFYTMYGGEVYLKQILIREKNIASSKTLAEDIYVNLKNGLNFETAAEKYSRDILTKSKKGNLGYVRWGQLPNELQKEAFNLEIGELSHPIQTPFGYYIIKVISRKRCGFEEEIRDLKYQLMTKYANRVENEKKIFFNNLWKNYQVQVINSNIEKVVGSLIFGLKPLDKIKKINLAVYKGGSVNLNTVIESMGESNFKEIVWDETLLSKKAGEIALNKVSIHEAERLNLNVEDDIENYRRQEIVRSVKQKYGNKFGELINNLIEKYPVKINDSIFSKFITNPLTLN